MFRAKTNRRSDITWTQLRPIDVADTLVRSLHAILLQSAASLKIIHIDDKQAVAFIREIACDDRRNSALRAMNMNPELRQTLNTVTRNLESANQAAQENIYTFTQLYLDPCLSGFQACVNDYTEPCLGDRDERVRRRRGRSRGRAELNFDFYDDWDEDAVAGNSLGGWGTDELDSLLAGNKAGRHSQPHKQKPMSYGSRGRPQKSTLRGEQDRDPTLIPKSSYFGFLDRLPFSLGTRPVRYQPSSADLQENPGGLRIRDEEGRPLMEENEESEAEGTTRRHKRQRSDTAASRSTTNSLSSRGDLLPSDDEDDAIPIDEAFAVELSRRTTNSEDPSSGKSSRRPGASKTSTRPASSRSTKSVKSRRSSSRKSTEPVSPGIVEATQAPTMLDLHQEEERLRKDEELEVEQKRATAQGVAGARGLSSNDVRLATEVKPDVSEEPLTPIASILPIPSDPQQDSEEAPSSPPGDAEDPSNTKPP